MWDDTSNFDHKDSGQDLGVVVSGRSLHTKSVDIRTVQKFHRISDLACSARDAFVTIGQGHLHPVYIDIVNYSVDNVNSNNNNGPHNMSDSL